MLFQSIINSFRRSDRSSDEPQKEPLIQEPAEDSLQFEAPSKSVKCGFGLHDYDFSIPMLYGVAIHILYKPGQSVATQKRDGRCKRCGKITIQTRSFVLGRTNWKTIV